MKQKTCGIFRICSFSDRQDWIVMLKHAHKQGDMVNILRADGTVKRIRLGERLDIVANNQPVPNCFRIAQETLIAVKPAAAEIAELERMSQLPSYPSGKF